MKWNIVFVWAGGAWLSAIVMILNRLGFENIVAINDEENEFTEKFEKLWIQTIIWHWNYTINRDDNVIFTEACRNSVEVKSANSFQRPQDKQVLIMNYFEFLWEISKYFKTAWIAGTNGKSTSTAMTICAAKDCLENFWIGIVGAMVPQLDNNNFFLNGKYKDEIQNIFFYIFNGKKLNYDNIKKFSMIVESCEYKRHFLNLDMDVLAITNIELDHTDYFKDFDDYQSAFQQMADKTKSSIFSVENLGITWYKKTDIEKFEFKYFFGSCNDENASIAKNIILELNGNNEIEWLKEKIQDFRWLRRRTELLLTNGKWAKLFSDYWHMASSIHLWFEALKAHFGDKKIKCIFQPHQMARIVEWWDDFPGAFEWYADSIIFDIYAAREDLKILSDFKNWICKNKTDLWNIFAENLGNKYTENFDEIIKFIDDCDENDIVIYYTAGDLDFKIRKHYWI